MHRLSFERIVYNDLNPKWHLFDSAFKIKMLERTEDSAEAEAIKDFAKWCYQSFTFNFILIEHSTTLLAGGYSDNAVGLIQMEETYPREQSYIDYYELRCSHSDELLLLLKYEGIHE